MPAHFAAAMRTTFAHSARWSSHRLDKKDKGHRKGVITKWILPIRAIFLAAALTSELDAPSSGNANHIRA